MDIIKLVHLWTSRIRIMAISNLSLLVKKITTAFLQSGNITFLTRLFPSDLNNSRDGLGGGVR